jgi:hypothetical protein
MNPLSQSQSSVKPMQIAQGSGFDVNAFIDAHSGRSSMYDVQIKVREIPGRVGNSIKRRAENAARNALSLGQGLLNKALQSLQGGQQ